MKAKTLLVGHDLENKVGEGEGVVCIQGNKNGEEILVNMDWSFDSSWSAQEIKSMLGGFLGNLEDVFGEKMVTEAIAHWGEDTGKLVKTGKGQAMVYSKSRGLDFKKGKK